MPGPYGPPRKMPFGDKYKGKNLVDIPTDELESAARWASKVDRFPDVVAEIAKIVAERRGGDGPAKNPFSGPAAPTHMAVTHAPSRDIHDMALLLIKVGANALDGLEHTGQAADWLRTLAGAPPPVEPF